MLKMHQFFSRIRLYNNVPDKIEVRKGFPKELHRAQSGTQTTLAHTKEKYWQRENKKINELCKIRKGSRGAHIWNALKSAATTIIQLILCIFFLRDRTHNFISFDIFLFFLCVCFFVSVIFVIVVVSSFFLLRCQCIAAQRALNISKKNTQKGKHLIYWELNIICDTTHSHQQRAEAAIHAHIDAYIRTICVSAHREN